MYYVRRMAESSEWAAMVTEELGKKKSHPNMCRSFKNAGIITRHKASLWLCHPQWQLRQTCLRLTTCSLHVLCVRVWWLNSHAIGISAWSTSLLKAVVSSGSGQVKPEVWKGDTCALYTHLFMYTKICHWQDAHSFWQSVGFMTYRGCKNDSVVTLII